MNGTPNAARKGVDVSEQEYFTKAEGAAYSRLSERTLDGAKARGELPFYRFGARKVLFSRRDLDKWLASMRVDVGARA
jgi:excisionase family DNA binding protein